MSNKNLNEAKKAKNDEFWTRIEDIEKELVNYQDFFNDKVVYCNCDHPTESNFPRYFLLNFEKLGLKKLVSTCFINDGNGWVGVKEKDGEYTVEQLEGNGDFRSEECIEFLKECDVVVTNPPFSLFREYVKQLMDYNKKFLIIGNQNAITYKDIFQNIKLNKIWLGINFVKEFVKPNKEIKKFGNICWYTNIPHKKRNTTIDLYKTYSEEKYCKYKNYDAIEVSKVTDIPEDYNGVIGVPITFLDKYCPTQFEIVGTSDRGGDNQIDYLKNKDWKGLWDSPFVNGNKVYKRLFIKRVKNNETKEI